MFRDQKLLVVAPHPDDEVIGAGGLIKRVKDDGGKVYVLFLTVGDTLDFTKRGISNGWEREKEIERVAQFLQYDDYRIAFKGNDFHLKLDSLGQHAIMRTLERENLVSLERVRPTIVAFPLVSSYNQDHRTAAEATFASLRPSLITTKHHVQTALSYEQASDAWTFHVPSQTNYFVTLTKMQVAAKLKALKLYKSQFRSSPSLRSPQVLEALAKMRGALCGEQFAEAFLLQRLTI